MHVLFSCVTIDKIIPSETWNQWSETGRDDTKFITLHLLLPCPHHACIFSNKEIWLRHQNTMLILLPLQVSPSNTKIILRKYEHVYLLFINF